MTIALDLLWKYSLDEAGKALRGRPWHVVAVDLDDAVACLYASSVGGAVSIDDADTSRQWASEGKSKTQGTLKDGDLWKRFI